MPPKGARTPMVWKENRENAYCEITPAILALKEQWEKKNYIDPKLYKEYNVKRGLRDEDGRGVLTGLTRVGEIQSYSVTEGEHIIPQDGMLYYRGIDCRELVKGSEGRRFAFEETAYLLLFGELPTAAQLEAFCQQLASYRTLPTNFFRDVIMKAPPRDLMNTMQRGILTLFCYDDKPNDIGLENVLRQCLQLMSNMPVLAIYAYQAWRFSQGESLFIHVPKPELSTAENFLRMLREDCSYTDLEARTLDVALILHADNGGGNNSTFTNHVAEGRNLPIGKVLDIAGGRVWLGKDALEVGLIDTYGGLKTAIALAVDKAELGDGYRVVEVKEEPTGFAAIIASLNVSVREAFARSELGLMMKEYNTVREALNQQGVLMYSPWKVEVR